MKRLTILLMLLALALAACGRRSGRGVGGDDDDDLVQSGDDDDDSGCGEVICGGEDPSEDPNEMLGTATGVWAACYGCSSHAVMGDLALTRTGDLVDAHLAVRDAEGLVFAVDSLFSLEIDSFGNFFGDVEGETTTGYSAYGTIDGVLEGENGSGRWHVSGDGSGDGTWTVPGSR